VVLAFGEVFFAIGEVVEKVLQGGGVITEGVLDALDGPAGDLAGDGSSRGAT